MVVVGVELQSTRKDALFLLLLESEKGQDHH